MDNMNIHNTVDDKLSSLHNEFVSRIYDGSRILILGSDSKEECSIFTEQGFKVKWLCESESKVDVDDKYKIVHSLSQVYEQEEMFDGIWIGTYFSHMEKDVFTKNMFELSKRLNAGGSFYLSLKYLGYLEENDEVCETRVEGSSLSDLIEGDSPLKILKEYIMDDASIEEGEDKWIHIFLVKKCDNKGIDKYIEKQNIIQDEEVEKVEGESVLDKSGNKVLKIYKGLENIDYEGTIDKVAQYVNIAGVASKIEKGIEYVVQIPVKYQEKFETGEYFINKNKTTGIEWPTLMKKTEKGQYRFVDDLPIKQQEIIKGNPFQDICNSYHNIYMQKAIAQMSERIEETYNTVKFIEQGQHDDRFALIESGRKLIMTGLELENNSDRYDQLLQGTRDLFTGREQIKKEMIRRIDAFDPLPEKTFQLFLKSLACNDYQSKKDDEIEKIQECYEMYLEATKMIAATYIYKNEISAAKKMFEDSFSELENIKFDNLKSIQVAHKGVNLEDMFYNNAVKYIEVEKERCLEVSEAYNCIEIEVTGEKLLEVLSNGRKVSKEEVK